MPRSSGGPAMSIYLRGKSWYYEFVYKGTRYGPTSIGPIPHEEALAIFTQVRTEVIKGRWCEQLGSPVEARAARVFGPIDVSRPTAWDRLARKYLAFCKSNLRPKTLTRYRRALNTLKPHFGRIALKDLGPAD